MSCEKRKRWGDTEGRRVRQGCGLSLICLLGWSECETDKKGQVAGMESESFYMSVTDWVRQRETDRQRGRKQPGKFNKSICYLPQHFQSDIQKKIQSQQAYHIDTKCLTQCVSDT